MKLKKNVTIKDFTYTISWEEIEAVLGKRRYKKFCKWLIGQTVTTHGVYPYDLDRFLKGLPILD